MHRLICDHTIRSTSLVTMNKTTDEARLALLKEIVDLENKLKGQNVNFSYLIPGFPSSSSSLTELPTHLKNSFRPDEVIPFLHSLLADVGVGLSKPSSADSTLSLASFEDNFEKEDFKAIRMRCFIVRVYRKLDNDLRSSFLQSICSMCNVNSQNYSDANVYELFQYIENTEYVHTRDETGLFFIFSVLTTNAEYSKVLTFAKEHIIKVCPELTVQKLDRSMTWIKEYKYYPQHVISELSAKIKVTYKDMPDIPSGDFFSPWPKVDRTRYVTLALVKNISITRDDDFSHRTLRKSEDDIPRHKDAVTYEEVFARKLLQKAQILISGRPGAGKTVLLTKVAKDWAGGKCLRDVNLLLHISLRELARKSDYPQLEDAISLCLLDKEKVHELAKVIDEVNGKGICFAFDGLDEYPKRNDPSDAIMKIIRKEFLPLATVIVSSRPTASSCVPVQSRDLHVEIIGFMPEQIKEYITQYYESLHTPREAQDLLSYLDSHPNVKDMCYLPLHLAMILYINQFKGSNPLPETETEIYTQFITHSIIRYIKREKAVNYINIRNFKDLERELEEEGQDELDLFHTICMIAFETKLVSHLIFGDSYLIDNFPDHFSRRANRNKLSKNGLGILSNYTKKVQTGEEPQYSFQHLTVQEFLGAYYLSRVSSEKCLEYIKLHGRSSDLREFWRFFFGLTKYSPSSPAYFGKILAANYTQGSETLFLARCLFEAQKSEYSTQNCRAFLASRKGKVDVSNIILNSPDCAAIGYSVSQCPLDLRELVMNYCQVGPGGIRAMNYQMDQVKAIFTNAINMQVRSQFNPLGNEGGSPLTDVLGKMPHLTELRLYGNELENQKLLELQPVISPMTNLCILVLTKNNLGPKSGETIGKVICNLRSLIQFYASYNPIGTKGLEALLPGLINCKQLQRLGFRDCQLSSKSGQLFSKIILQLSNLEQLELYLNQLGDDGIEDMIESLKVAPNLKQLSFTQNGITDKGGCRLAELAEVTPSLQQMRLFYNQVSDVTRKAFYDAAQKRAQRELHEVRYAI